MSSINVKIVSFNNLLNKEITIPDFQRSYVWKKENLKKLIDDFEEFLTSQKTEYYMGTILLYQDGKTNEIIDGQQRITTLTILYSMFDSNFIPENFILAFSSQESINNIVNAKKYFEDNRGRIEHIKDIFKKLKFTLITTKSQDKAFTFFDTQNSRGVKLKAIDLLKAHHLRAIKSNDKQSVSAKKWEKIESTKNGFIRKNSDFIDELFKYILYRSRVWKGNKSSIIDIETSKRVESEKIKFEFEKGHQSDSIQLYPHHKNMVMHSIDIDENEDFIFDFRWKQNQRNPKDLPFSLRQPISKGLEFFLYIEKYAQIVDLLISENIKISDYQNFYEKVICDSSFSIYLREFFILCVVCYYDKFEEQKLFEFALWLEYILGAVRIKQSMIVERTITKTIRELPYNIIDIIMNAYTSNEVIEYLTSIEKFEEKEIEKIYSEYVPENKENQTSIRDRYLKSILKYYGRDRLTRLKNKRTWIEQKVKYV